MGTVLATIVTPVAAIPGCGVPPEVTLLPSLATAVHNIHMPAQMDRHALQRDRLTDP
jgi:hypothetical protein